MVERRGDRVLAALMSLDEALAAEGGGHAAVTLPEDLGRAERLAGLDRPIGRDFAAGTVAVKSGFRWGKLLVLWASPAGGKPPARQPS